MIIEMRRRQNPSAVKVRERSMCMFVSSACLRGHSSMVRGMSGDPAPANACTITRTPHRFKEMLLLLLLLLLMMLMILMMMTMTTLLRSCFATELKNRPTWLQTHNIQYLWTEQVIYRQQPSSIISLAMGYAFFDLRVSHVIIIISNYLINNVNEIMNKGFKKIDCKCS